MEMGEKKDRTEMVKNIKEAMREKSYGSGDGFITYLLKLLTWKWRTYYKLYGQTEETRKTEEDRE